jgi:hypothetical protein
MIRQLSGRLPPGFVICCMHATPLRSAHHLRAEASKWAAGQLSRLMLSAGSGHHTPSDLIHTHGGSAEVSNFAG